jgi:hypothetical protein
MATDCTFLTGGADGGVSPGGGAADLRMAVSVEGFTGGVGSGGAAAG